MKSKLVWKLGAAVVAILAAAIALSGYINNLICAHYSLESARESLKFNSESTVQGIRQLMMSRNNDAIEELLVEISQDSTVYGDIRLVSHHSGKVVASRFGQTCEPLVPSDRSCAICHDRSDLGGSNGEIVDMLIESPEGHRALSVVAPILNEPGCSNAVCHVHAAHPPILGFLTAEYSLQRVDATANDRRLVILVTVLVSLALGIVAVWVMFTRLLERPIAQLIAGTECIAANQFDFRFDRKRSDEIGVLEESFNTMTAKIQADREALRSAKEYLEGMVENSADIIITVDADGLIKTFHRGGEEALGYCRDEVIGTQIEDLYADPGERHRIAARLKEAGSIKNYETGLLAKDGQVRSVLLTLSQLRDPAGNPIGTIGISKDITQEKKLQRALLQSQKLAAIGQAVTGIQHAIKNMLNSLKGGAYLVRNGMTGDNRQRIQRGWEMIEEGIERIKHLSQNMLNYAREWKPKFERVDLGDLVAEICELNQQTAADRGVALRCEGADGVPAVLCDPKLIHMAASDLVVNAIDACASKDYRDGESPEVLLTQSLPAGEDFSVIEVRDNGCGMNQETRRNIFTPFFSTKELRGTGLGLALTARIISLHAGEIFVDSEPDQGTTFRIRLPKDGPRDLGEVVDG